MNDIYKTIKGVSEGVYKEKGSKFIARAYHVENIVEIKEVLIQLRKEFYDARHHCYAWRIDARDEKTRSNDDGEPSGSAGKPILNQIFSFNLYDIIVVVIRYFGGTKLGVSGLINAYKVSTREALENANMVVKEIRDVYQVDFEYSLMNSVMRIIKEDNLAIVEQHFDNQCSIKLAMRLSTINKSTKRLNKIPGVNVKKL
ncbi:MAG: YigZ family protein [Bacteroidetes bacterium]|nr:MAG: YigZ family protein [Bacteroidota bacterium]